MTLLLVDDEYHVRQKILSRIDWSALAIDTLHEADNGESAYQYALKNKIDILLSDIRMPHMTGIELAEKIRNLYPNCVILFLSGYSDKEYLRSAISLHALHYIDKPIVIDQVTQALQDACEYCHQLTHSEDFAHSIQREQLTRLLCTPQPDSTETDRLLRECDISPLSFCDSRTILIQFYASDHVPGSFQSHLEALLSQCKVNYLLAEHHDNLFILHLLSSDDTLVSSYTNGFLQTLLQRVLYLAEPDSCFIAVGTLAKNRTELYASYQSAVIALQQNFFLGAGSVSYADTNLPPSPPWSEDLSRDTLNALRQKDSDTCFSLLHTMYLFWYEHPGNLVSVVRECYYQLLTQLVRYCQSHHIDFQSAYPKQLWDSIVSAPTLQDLHNIAQNLVQSFLAYTAQNVEALSISGQICQIIEESYGNPDLGIAYIADLLHLSQSYISQIFKQETGNTINQYIISCRIDNACDLLLTCNEKIADIGKRCGFPDQNYFTKIFKKSTGMTPSDYRGNL